MLVRTVGGQGSPARTTAGGGTVSPLSTAGGRGEGGLTHVARSCGALHAAGRRSNPHAWFVSSFQPPLLSCMGQVAPIAGAVAFLQDSAPPCEQGCAQLPSQFVMVTSVPGVNRLRWVSCRQGRGPARAGRRWRRCRGR